MAKVKQPLLSLGMSGSVGGSLTGQRSKSRDILREKPTPRDPYSLAQAYHRWTYQDYLAWWATLSTAEKRAFSAAGSRTHNTAVGAFLQEKLSTLPDIMGWWRLDEAAGAVAHDSSKNSNHAPIIGASPTPGVIDGARLFDGINDSITVPNAPSLNPVGAGACMCFYTPTALLRWNPLIDKEAGNPGAWPSYAIYVTNHDEFAGCISDGVGLIKVYTSVIRASVDTLYHIALTWDSVNAWLYVNGVDLASGPHGLNPAGNTHDLRIGRWTAFWAAGMIDDLRLYDRTFTQAQIQAISERRYSLQ